MPVSRFGRPLLILALSGLLALGQVPPAEAAPAAKTPADLWALSESGVEATGVGLVRPDWLSAATTARASGQRVEVLSECSETSRSWLLPNGQVLVEQFTAPVRFKESTLKSAGWRDIDMTLVVRADGTVGPKAAPTSVVLSGGGVGPMVSRTEASGVKASLDPAPGVKLGKPVLSGSKATYSDVAPGLDVVVDVAAGGFRWSWVAKTPAAAKKLLVGSGKSRAATARLKVTGGGKWARDAAEAKISNGQGAKVARLGSPLVWDAQVNPATKEPVNVVEAELVLQTSPEQDSELTDLPFVLPAPCRMRD
ncbi:hypothetical protein SAMN06266982_12522 [Propioniciclava tarda]|nr:hypothetical protein SAMN06266982_12522 [Propioniciclava tarda]